jgi:hypothetical protein
LLFSFSLTSSTQTLLRYPLHSIFLFFPPFNLLCLILHCSLLHRLSSLSSNATSSTLSSLFSTNLFSILLSLLLLTHLPLLILMRTGHPERYQTLLLFS